MFFIMGFSGLVTSLCALWPGSFTDMLASQMQHAAWNGLTIQDTIFPLFLLSQAWRSPSRWPNSVHADSAENGFWTGFSAAD